MTGLKSCDTCRKAQKWLNENGIQFEYRDVKADGVSESDLAKYVDKLGWDKAINKASTTWRSLGETAKSDIDPAKAVALLKENPSLMKRPLFDINDEIVLGFRNAQKDKLLELCK